MNETPVLPAPQLAELPNGHSKWESEYRAFLRLRPTLMPQFAGKYVAIHEGKVVDEGNDQVEVALKAYQRFGYLPIYVGKLPMNHRRLRACPRQLLDGPRLVLELE